MHVTQAEAASPVRSDGKDFVVVRNHQGFIAQIAKDTGEPYLWEENSLILEFGSHLNKGKIESNLSAPGIEGRHESTLIKSFEMNLHFIGLSRLAPTSL